MVQHKSSTIRPLVTVRHEFFGPLLYSTPLRTYLIPKTREATENLFVALENINRNQQWDLGLDINSKNDLENIGFNGGVRQLYSTFTDRLMAPLECYFDYTDKCNLNCHYCYNINFRKGNTLPQELVSQIINELYDSGVMRLYLAGGEPTIDIGGFANYLKTASQLGIIISMVTNGTLLDDARFSAIMESNLISVSVSIDGSNENDNSTMRGKGHFKRAISNLRKLLEHRNRFGGKFSVVMKPTYTTSTTPNQIEALVQLAIDVGVDKISFANPERSLNHDRGHYGNDVAKHYEIMIFIKQLELKYGSKLGFMQIANPIIGCRSIGLPNFRGCIGGQELISINGDGIITPCSMHHEVLGSVYSWGSLKEFWGNSLALKTYNNALLENTQCDHCSIYHQCRGGCQVRKKVEKGFPNSKDPLCPHSIYSNVENIALESADSYGLTHFSSVRITHSL